MVAPAVSLLTTVKMVKPQRREVFLNDGIYGALMEVSQSHALMPRHRVIRDGRTIETGTGEWTVYGPTCDPLDVLPLRLRSPTTSRKATSSSSPPSVPMALPPPPASTVTARARR